MPEMVCVVCGKRGPENTAEADRQGWDWFTQHLDETVHFCPEHQNSDRRKQLWNISQVPRTRTACEACGGKGYL
jgi:hypothetical protein